MLPLNDYTLLKDYELNKLPVILARAEEHRLLSEAGLIRRPRSAHLWVALVPGLPVTMAAGAPVGEGRSAAGTTLRTNDPEPRVGAYVARALHTGRRNAVR